MIPEGYTRLEKQASIERSIQSEYFKYFFIRTHLLRDEQQ